MAGKESIMWAHIFKNFPDVRDGVDAFFKVKENQDVDYEEKTIREVRSERTKKQRSGKKRRANKWKNPQFI